jgi:aminoglycoside 6'-N-acetyltransferase I
MDVVIRQMGRGDRRDWAAMRTALWPDEPLELHAREIEALLDGAAAWGFIAQAMDGAPAGFAELALRSYANGCKSRPVPFLEGIWVAEPLRRRGIGAKLIAHIEGFARARGYREIGSDALLANHASHDAHHAWGFAETERVIYFRKLLDHVAG